MPTRPGGAPWRASAGSSAASASSRLPSWSTCCARELASTLSPGERLQRMLHPWTSYLIVPVFALANAGVPLGAAARGRLRLAGHPRHPARLRTGQADRRPRLGWLAARLGGCACRSAGARSPWAARCPGWASPCPC
ncbi:Na+/H+ antiporter NhaA [Streptomyces thermogriseus]|uniref:Na+/H+ antiporter NhaA n=1 Tax=Streptomyces thermogriseus TaxID=75292 RepID=UPI003616EA9F